MKNTKYDRIADLYKADISIPLAFKIASDHGKDDDIGSITRREIRDIFASTNIMEKIVKDLQELLEVEEQEKIEIDSIKEYLLKKIEE